jgi:16S rRNA (cytosine1407-C5)-methyltransferase
LTAKRRAKNPAAAPAPSAAPSDLAFPYLDMLPEAEHAAFLRCAQNPIPTGLRFNPLKCDPAQEAALLAERCGWVLEPVTYCPHGYTLAPGSPTRPGSTFEYRLGRYYIQDAASMLPVGLFDLPDEIPPGTLVLDLAAAPGGKTTHLVSRTDDRALVIANDATSSRIPALRKALQDWGAARAAVTSFPGELFGQWYPGLFDLVLLDAPCSMENFHFTPGKPARAVSQNERRGLAKRQLGLLASAVQAARPGGQIVYSTCTLAPEEDEGVLDALLRLYPGAVEVCAVDRRAMGAAPGLSAFAGQAYAPEVARALRLWPHRTGTSGFFTARLTKTADLARAPANTPRPEERPERLGPTRMPARARRDFCALFLETFGFDLQACLETHRLELWQKENAVFAYPDDLFTRLGRIPFHGAGLVAADYYPAGIQPTHDWVTRFGGQFQRGVITLPDELLPAWQTGRDLPEMAGAGVPGRTLVVVVDTRGRVLGRGKILADRLKNLLPRSLV